MSISGPPLIKTAKVLNKLPKSMQHKVKVALHDIWTAETKEDANTAFYDFPTEHWVHIRTTNPIESTFSTVRLRTKKSRNCRPREPPWQWSLSYWKTLRSVENG